MPPHDGGYAGDDGFITGMACSYTNCEAPSIPGAPFCFNHLSQIDPSFKKEINPHSPSKTPSASDYADPGTQTTKFAAAKARRLSATYLLRKSASSTGIRQAPPKDSTLTISSGGVAPVLSARHGAKDKAVFPDKDTSIPVSDAFLSPTESSPELRESLSRELSRPGSQSSAWQLDGAIESRQARRGRDALRTPRSGSSDVDDATPPPKGDVERPLGQSRDDIFTKSVHNESGTTLLSPPERRSSLLRRVLGRDRGRERGRKALATAMDFSLDTYIYNQDPSVAPLPPPPNVVIASKADLAAAASAASMTAAVAASYAAAAAVGTAASGPSLSPSSPSYEQTSPLSHPLPSSPSYIYAHIDPRVHWTRSRSKEWHAAKQQEIKTRGGRKANMGMAAQRMAAQRRRDIGSSSSFTATGIAKTANGSKPSQPPPSRGLAAWKGDLPTEVLQHEGWMAMMNMFVRDEDARLKRVR